MPSRHDSLVKKSVLLAAACGLILLHLVRVELVAQSPTPTVTGRRDAATEEGDRTRLRGRVVDDRGQGVSGAQVVLVVQYYDDVPSVRTKPVLSGRDGQFEVAFPSQWVTRRNWHPSMTLWAGTSNGCVSFVEQPPVRRQSQTSELAITLARVNTEDAITVLDPEGRPLPNAQITVGASVKTVIPNEFSDRVQRVTDAQGQVRWPQIRSVSWYFLRVTTQQFGIQLIAISDTGEHSRTVHLRAVGRLEGRVTCQIPEKTRGLRLLVRSYLPDGSNRRANVDGMALVTTSQDGTFEVPAIAAGSFSVWPWLPVQEPYRQRRVPNDIRVRAHETTQVTLTLERTIPVVGKVETKKEREPVAGAVLFVRDQYVLTDSDGRYSAFALPGERIEATLLRVPDGYFRGSPITLRPTVPLDCERFEMPNFTPVLAVQISGQVVNERGEPVPGVRVIAHSSPQSVAHQPTDKDGSFSLRVPQGQLDRSSHAFLVAYPNGILGHAGVSRRDPLTLLTLQVEYDRLAIQGIWDVVSWTESGKRRSQSELKGNQLFVTADRLLVWNDKSLVASYAYEIDASREPGQIVVVRNEMTGWGIYRLRDDSLTVCINRDGKRPREFRSEPGSGNDLWILKSNSTSPALVGAQSWRSAHALLDQTEAEFIDTPLRDAIAYLGELHNVPIVIDANALKATGIDEDVPISLIISGVRLASVLHIMLRPLGLTYELRGKQIVITTAP